ncbi:MAG TPA: hypothetical protein VF601_24090 [Beijerinckiaceae bacterium]|jgi:hypothetical protein
MHILWHKGTALPNQKDWKSATGAETFETAGQRTLLTTAEMMLTAKLEQAASSRLRGAVGAPARAGRASHSPNPVLSSIRCAGVRSALNGSGR